MEIEGYDQIELLAHGGFAIVYRAVRTVDGHPVAIKVLNKLGPAEEVRFERELISLTALSKHPNVVEVFDSGRTTEGAPYLALEFVSGGSLKDAMADEPLGVGDAAWIAARLLDALEAAHGQGIVHRDVKPSNVLLGRGDVLLADFGIARFTEGTETTTSALTTTIQYAAPETLLGGTSSVQSDLYSLGATVSALVTGRPIHLDWKDAYAAANQSTPPDLSEVPEPLRGWLTPLLAPEPGDRPVSAAAARSELLALDLIDEPSKRLRMYLDVTATVALPIVPKQDESVTTRFGPMQHLKPPPRPGLLQRWGTRTVVGVGTIALILALAGAAAAMFAPWDGDGDGGSDTEDLAGQGSEDEAEADGDGEAATHDGDDGTDDEAESDAVDDPLVPDPEPADRDGDDLLDIDDRCPDEHGDGAPDGCRDGDGDGVPFSSDACPETPGHTSGSGCPDADGDGVVDDRDACPGEAGDPQDGGCPDRDGDGVIDGEDACPDDAGPAATTGCPDADGDGVVDDRDACPGEAGDPQEGGCPDRDGDGVIDGEDACPDDAGPAATTGCPDRDGDGVADRGDACPNDAGPAATAGCPDRDGDGVADRDEAHPLCVNQAGPASNGGCRLPDPCSSGDAPESERVDFDRGDGRTGDLYVSNGCQHYVELAGTTHRLVVNGSDILLRHLFLGYFNHDDYIDVFRIRGENWHVAFAFDGGWSEPVQNSKRKLSELQACDANGDRVTDIYDPRRGQYSQSSGSAQLWSRWQDGRC